MKKTTSLHLQKISFLLAISFLTACQPKAFEGIIEYSFALSDLPEAQNEAMQSNGIEIPKEQLIIKGDLIRLTTPAGLSGTQTLIYNSKTNTRALIVDYGELKFFIEISDSIAKAQQIGTELPDVIYDKKQINFKDFKAKTATIQYKGSDIENIIFTKEINSTHPSFIYLRGFPLQYQSVIGGYKMQATVNKIERKLIDNSTFNVPENYKKISFVEFLKMMKR